MAVANDLICLQQTARSVCAAQRTNLRLETFEKLSGRQVTSRRQVNYRNGRSERDRISFSPSAEKRITKRLRHFHRVASDATPPDPTPFGGSSLHFIILPFN
jgi:hypothetical protein